MLSSSLVTQVNTLSRLAALIGRLQQISQATSILGGSELLGRFCEAEKSIRRVQDALREVEEGIRHWTELQGSQPAPEDLAIVHDSIEDTVSLVEALSGIVAAVRSSECSLFTQGGSSVTFKSVPDHQNR